MVARVPPPGLVAIAEPPGEPAQIEIVQMSPHLGDRPGAVRHVGFQVGQKRFDRANMQLSRRAFVWAHQGQR